MDQAGAPRRAGASRHFTAAEIRAVMEGDGGVKGMLPARCYYDDALYREEVARILKKNWLCVGRWDWAEKPGDYFTLRMFDEPLVIVRDRAGELHALINACQHRWAQVVPDGAGNAQMLVCPYHSWTYELDGRLRGVSVKPMPNLDVKTCRLPALRLEEWGGFIFVNFDERAAPLGPQLQGLDEVVGRFGLATHRTGGRTAYDAPWNYKFSFETGYEAYHNEGVHKSLLGGTAALHTPLAYGEIWGAYHAVYPPSWRGKFPFGRPPWLPAAEEEAYVNDAIFFGIYPNFVAFCSPHQISFITTEFGAVAANRATTAIAFADWAYGRPGADEMMAKDVEAMKAVQDQDTAGCRMLQGGIRSSYNRRSMVHPDLEPQLSHYYAWWMNEFARNGD